MSCIEDQLTAFLVSQGYSLARAQELVAQDGDAVGAIQASITELGQEELAHAAEGL